MFYIPDLSVTGGQWFRQRAREPSNVIDLLDYTSKLFSLQNIYLIRSIPFAFVFQFLQLSLKHKFSLSLSLQFSKTRDAQKFASTYRTWINLKIRSINYMDWSAFLRCNIRGKDWRDAIAEPTFERHCRTITWCCCELSKWLSSAIITSEKKQMTMPLTLREEKRREEKRDRDRAKALGITYLRVHAIVYEYIRTHIHICIYIST